MDRKLKKIALLGSTGSIGVQTLDVVEKYPHLFKATILIAGSKVDTLIEQAIRFRPELAIIADTGKYKELHKALEPFGIETASGAESIIEAMSRECFSTLVNATVGYSGLAPTLTAIESGKDIALANKETLVVAGEIVTQMIKERNVRLMPIDSEHSAIYQCLVGEKPESVRKLIITASGGPFRNFTLNRIANASVADALNHPNWAMGAKITIDSATMLNKSLEIIEARWLFDIPGEKIEPIVHPQSIIHSMVEFNDGAVKAQLGVPDMRLPIRYALGESLRLPSDDNPLDFTLHSTLTFEKPDEERFPCVKLGHYALEKGGNAACIINASNEIAVASFLKGEIKFPDIYRIIIETLERAQFIERPAYQDYVDSNCESRRIASEIVNSYKLTR